MFLRNRAIHVSNPSPQERQGDRRDMSSKTLKQIAELETLAVPELKVRWRKLFGTEPPTHQRRFLIKRLAYRVQELVYGGLSEEVRRRAAEIAANH
jgi:hypothetical protein